MVARSKIRRCWLLSSDAESKNNSSRAAMYQQGSSTLPCMHFPLVIWPFLQVPPDVASLNVPITKLTFMPIQYHFRHMQ